MEGIEDLLDFFNTEETKKIIDDHILNPDDYGIGQPVDYYRPYHVKYNMLHVDIDKGYTEAEVRKCREKATEIALMFISAICEKFNLVIDEGWLENKSESDLQDIALMLYSLFILNLKEILIEVFTKYIDKNHDDLSKAYDNNPKNNKDATYISLKKILPSDFVVIGANIYEVCYLILDMLNEEEFFTYIDADTEFVKKFMDYFSEGYISGNFLDVIDDMLRSNTSGLKSTISFELMAYIINTHSFIIESIRTLATVTRDPAGITQYHGWCI